VVDEWVREVKVRDGQVGGILLCMWLQKGMLMEGEVDKKINALVKESKTALPLSRYSTCRYAAFSARCAKTSGKIRIRCMLMDEGGFNVSYHTSHPFLPCSATQW
jgi:hypothetical protein